MFTSIPVLITSAIGAAVLAKLGYSVVSFLTFHFLPFGNSLERYQRRPRAWAIVTGSSAGMGMGCAQELAMRGFGVIILAHKLDEVNAAVATIRAECADAAVEKIVLDATKATYVDVQSALAPYMHLPITILVNNVAVQTSTPLFTHFESYKPADIANSINANTLFLCNITHVLYPVLKQNGPSLVINISSGGHLVSLPWMTVYVGTKAFVESWSKSVSRESKLQGDAIDSLVVIPGDVRTQGNLYGVAPGSPTGRQFARMYLDRVGRAIARGRTVITPYWKHDIQLILATTLPDSMVGPPTVADMENRMREEREAMRKRA